MGELICNKTTLFFSNSYTANLAAHLTASFAVTEFDNVEALRENDIPIYVSNSIYMNTMFKVRFPKAYEEVVSKKRTYGDFDDFAAKFGGANAVVGYNHWLKKLKTKNCSLKVHELCNKKLKKIQLTKLLVNIKRYLFRLV